jgi:hypothetical protein
VRITARPDHVPPKFKTIETFFDAEAPWYVALIDMPPWLTPVNRPAESTVAMPELLLDHVGVTVCDVPFDIVAVAV